MFGPFGGHGEGEHGGGRGREGEGDITIGLSPPLPWTVAVTLVVSTLSSLARNC